MIVIWGVVRTGGTVQYETTDHLRLYEDIGNGKGVRRKRAESFFFEKLDEFPPPSCLLDTEDGTTLGRPTGRSPPGRCPQSQGGLLAVERTERLALHCKDVR